MIEFKTKEEIKKIKESGKILHDALQAVKGSVKPGIKTIELNEIFERFVVDSKAIPACKGYNGFPTGLCISVNDEIVHGIPGERILEEGDVVSCDACVLYNGWFSDSTFTIIVGHPKRDIDMKLVEITEQAFYIGIEQARVGKRIGDVSYAIQKFVEDNGFSVVREYAGHGIGKKMHEDPPVPNFGRPGRGPLIREGLCIAVEPMVCEGKPNLFIEENRWTAKTIDGLNAAHFEHTICIGNNGPEILTA